MQISIPCTYSSKRSATGISSCRPRANAACAQLVAGLERHAEVEDRLHKLKRLSRKYGGEIAGILAFREEATAEAVMLAATHRDAGATTQHEEASA